MTPPSCAWFLKNPVLKSPPLLSILPRVIQVSIIEDDPGMVSMHSIWIVPSQAPMSLIAIVMIPADPDQMATETNFLVGRGPLHESPHCEM